MGAAGPHPGIHTPVTAAWAAPSCLLFGILSLRMHPTQFGLRISGAASHNDAKRTAAPSASIPVEAGRAGSDAPSYLEFTGA